MGTETEGPRSARRAPRSTPRNQRYYDWKGRRYWSVTQITKGGLPESYGLKRWNRNAVAEGAVREVQEGTLVGMVERNPRGAMEYLAELPFSKSSKARELGTAVHTAIEALVLGTPAPDPSPEELPFLEQFEAFRQAYAPEFLAAESTVFNREHSYAGTLDAVVTIDGRTYVLDVKTGAGVYAEVALQLSAYAHAEFMGLPNGEEVPMLEVQRDYGLCLHLQPEHFDLRRVQIGEPVLNAFLYAREGLRWDTVLSKQVLEGNLPRPNGEEDPSFDPAIVGMFGDPGPER